MLGGRSLFAIALVSLPPFPRALVQHLADDISEFGEVNKIPVTNLADNPGFSVHNWIEQNGYESNNFESASDVERNYDTYNIPDELYESGINPQGHKLFEDVLGNSYIMKEDGNLFTAEDDVGDTPVGNLYDGSFEVPDQYASDTLTALNGKLIQSNRNAQGQKKLSHTDGREFLLQKDGTMHQLFSDGTAGDILGNLFLDPDYINSIL